MDTLLFKMKESGEIVRIKRGVYGLVQDAGKIGQKERNEAQSTENKELNGHLTNLTDLTGSVDFVALGTGALREGWYHDGCHRQVADRCSRAAT
jgi:hypothetical protein